MHYLVAGVIRGPDAPGCDNIKFIFSARVRSLQAEEDKEFDETCTGAARKSPELSRKTIEGARKEYEERRVNLKHYTVHVYSMLGESSILPYREKIFLGRVLDWIIDDGDFTLEQLATSFPDFLQDENAKGGS